MTSLVFAGRVCNLTQLPQRHFASCTHHLAIAWRILAIAGATPTCTGFKMSSFRNGAFIAITTTLVFGTTYSLIYNTSLDTSNPLLTHLPHPRSHTDYFASKQNFLNVWFIKKAWGWTTLAFMALWATGVHGIRTKRRLIQWAAETAVWLVFVSWFFGPALLDRITSATGGECILVLPSDDIMNVPVEYCYRRETISANTHPTLFTSPLKVLISEADWKATPRLRRGHDVSGHVFLLTMSLLFLCDQLKHSYRAGAERWSVYHKVAVAFNLALVGVWMFAIYTTSVYFHTPQEKFTGYCEWLSTSTLAQN